MLQYTLSIWLFIKDVAKFIVQYRLSPNEHTSRLLFVDGDIFNSMFGSRLIEKHGESLDVHITETSAVCRPPDQPHVTS